MKINCSYDGASIEIVNIDNENNVVNLSLKKELEGYSDYFNFIVENFSKKGKVIIHNIKHNSSFIPLVKVGNKYQKIDSRKVLYGKNSIEITIESNVKMEISAYPRYTIENLHDYLDKVKEICNYEEDIIPKITINNNKEKDIVIIARQHPGETLSSFFIEGIIDYLKENIKITDYNFIIYPIVNINGVKNGNHRYFDDKDYNRLWFKNGIVKEEDIIKEELEKCNLELFVDVHCDEFSNFDYLRIYPNKKIENKDFMILNDYNKIKRFFKGLVQNKKIVNVKNASAREYVYKKYKCTSILVELSLIINNEDIAYKKGLNFFNKLIKK